MTFWAVVVFFLRAGLGSLMVHLLRVSQRDQTDQRSGLAQTINLEVDITPGLKSRANADDTVFVYAKATQGPPMPLAVKKLKLSDLPVTVVLGDSDKMIPSMKLSSFDQVTLGARVSMSGKLAAQYGDFFNEIKALDRTPPTQRITLQMIG